MDSGQNSTLMDALKDIPDSRKRRGKRHDWRMVLTILVSALASGYQNARASAQWAKLPADELRQCLPALQRIPSESTMVRTLRRLDGAVVDRLLTASTASLPTLTDHDGCIITLQGEVLQGQAGRRNVSPASRPRVAIIVQDDEPCFLSQWLAHNGRHARIVPKSYTWGNAIWRMTAALWMENG